MLGSSSNSALQLLLLVVVIQLFFVSDFVQCHGDSSAETASFDGVASRSQPTAQNYLRSVTGQGNKEYETTTLEDCLAPAGRHYSQVIFKHANVMIQKDAEGNRRMVATGDIEDGDIIVAEHTTSGSEIQYMIADDKRLFGQLYPRSNNAANNDDDNVNLVMEDPADPELKIPLVEQKLIANLWSGIENDGVKNPWIPRNLLVSHFISAANHHCDANAVIDHIPYDIEFPIESGQRIATITVTTQYVVAAKKLRKGDEIFLSHYEEAGHEERCHETSRSPLLRFRCNCRLSKVEREKKAMDLSDIMDTHITKFGEPEIAEHTKSYMLRRVGLCTPIRQHVMTHFEDLLRPDVRDDMEQSFRALKAKTSQAQIRKYYEAFPYYLPGVSPVRVLSDVQWIHRNLKDKNILEFLQREGPAWEQLHETFTSFKQRIPEAMEEHILVAEEEQKMYVLQMHRQSIEEARMRLFAMFSYLGNPNDE